jgi:cystathionine beta-lyase/cystathionine gamma-synthase
MNRTWRLDTQLIHAGEPRPRIGGAVNMPIFQSSTFEYTGEGDYHDVRYLRCSNTPNHVALHAKLAALEGGEAGLVTASGMAAISGTLLSLLGQGDHVLAHGSLYGGTLDFVRNDLAKLGIPCTFVDADDRSSWTKALRPTTRVFYVETLTNPLLQVLDLEGVVEFCRAHDLVSIIDNTCATPINCRPLTRGFDLVVHSASKYLNGHSDIVAGVVVGAAERVGAVKRKLDHLGGSLDAHTCFLLHRGLKTLALRVRHQNESTLAVARFLEAHPAVARVNYPGLESHARHARAKEWLSGMGGLLSFELEGAMPAAERFVARAKIPAYAPSLGGTETLMTLPSTTSHAGMPPEERRRQGIADDLVRIAVGLEAPEDLVADFGQALEG